MKKEPKQFSRPFDPIVILSAHNLPPKPKPKLGRYSRHLLRTMNQLPRPVNFVSLILLKSIPFSPPIYEYPSPSHSHFSPQLYQQDLTALFLCPSMNQSEYSNITMSSWSFCSRITSKIFMLNYKPCKICPQLSVFNFNPTLLSYSKGFPSSMLSPKWWHS